MRVVRTKDLLDNFDLTIVAGADGIHREISSNDISRPAFEMTGFFEYYPKERIQIIGQTEMNYFKNLSTLEKRDRAKRLCTDVTPGIIVSNWMDVPDVLLDAANDAGVPILKSARPTSRVIVRITNYLESRFAPTTAVHGVLVDIYGVGVLILGQSGVGKSETALELVKRGHRLVADDSVEIRQEDYDTLIGSAPPLIEHLLEIRGLGILNIMTLFGAGAVKKFKRISYVVQLELWDDKKQYERLGIEEEMMKIMDVEIPKATIPVRPGRNLAVIIEVAAMNFRLKRMGVNAAADFSDQLATIISDNNEPHFE
ncbi:MAG TPA: HPr(Ser) kinase/phosphatase [Pseudogracilibacillus sp.]|nr:HPr(Ser) kinase/phosphatase [Pseudogracilibacillus sp.]